MAIYTNVIQYSLPKFSRKCERTESRKTWMNYMGQSWNWFCLFVYEVWNSIYWRQRTITIENNEKQKLPMRRWEKDESMFCSYIYSRDSIFGSWKNGKTRNSRTMRKLFSDRFWSLLESKLPNDSSIILKLLILHEWNNSTGIIF